MHIKIVNPQMHHNHSQINRISNRHLFLGDLPFECFLLGDDVTKQCFILSLPGRVPVNQPPLTEIYSMPRVQCNSRTLLHMLLENSGELCIAMTGFIFQCPHYFCIFERWHTICSGIKKKKIQNKTALTFDYGNGSSQILGYIQWPSRMCAPVM